MNELYPENEMTPLWGEERDADKPLNLSSTPGKRVARTYKIYCVKEGRTPSLLLGNSMGEYSKYQFETRPLFPIPTKKGRAGR